jgi:predicted transcriptional regulator
VVAFGYYLEEHSGLKDFTPADLSNCYYEAKMETSNVSQSIIQNIKRGYLMEAKGDQKKKKGRRYTVTSSGQAFVKKIARGSDTES